MRRNKEIIILLTLLLGTMAFVLWYVLDRRSHLPVTAQPSGPLAPANPITDLTQHDGQTIDFSSGKPVIKNTPEDQAALAAAARDIAEATKDITFEAPAQQP